MLTPGKYFTTSTHHIAFPDRKPSPNWSEVIVFRHEDIDCYICPTVSYGEYNHTYKVDEEKFSWIPNLLNQTLNQFLTGTTYSREIQNGQPPEDKLDKIKNLVIEGRKAEKSVWDYKDAYWYYPELLGKMAKILNIDEVDEIYGKENTDVRN